MILSGNSRVFSLCPANFAMTDEDEITESGFLGLQEMAAGDEEGGEAELWQCLTAMGYNKQLKLIQVRGWRSITGGKEMLVYS